MKVGDLINWHGFLGVVVDPYHEKNHHLNTWIIRVVWADGGTSVMYEDEVEVLNESR